MWHRSRITTLAGLEFPRMRRSSPPSRASGATTCDDRRRSHRRSYARFTMVEKSVKAMGGQRTAGAGVSDATRTICSHFAPITPRNRVERDEERRTIRQRGTACCRTHLLQDQRVTGHGRLVLITQRSLVQIQPPRNHEIKGFGKISRSPWCFLSVFLGADRRSSMLRCGGTSLENASLSPPESEGPPESRGALGRACGFSVGGQALPACRRTTFGVDGRLSM